MVSMPATTTELQLPNPTTPAVTELAELTPIVTIPPPISLVAAGPVPEPSSLLLALSGAAFIAMLLGMRALLPQCR